MSYDIQIGLACKTVATKAEADRITSILAEIAIPCAVEAVVERYCVWGHAVYEGNTCPECGFVIQDSPHPDDAEDEDEIEEMLGDLIDEFEPHIGGHYCRCERCLAMMGF
jgi:hypothetical protein